MLELVTLWYEYRSFPSSKSPRSFDQTLDPKIIDILWFYTNFLKLYNSRNKISKYFQSSAEVMGSALHMMYRKVASSRLSHLVTLFMMGKLDAYIPWPLAKRVQNWIVDWCTAWDFTVFQFGPEIETNSKSGFFK